MLVLTRKAGEGIAIGDEIRVVIMTIRGKQVRVGIETGQQIPVHREEIYQKIQEENLKASSLKKESLIFRAPWCSPGLVPVGRKRR